MSLLELFRKFVDPIEHRREQLERKRAREALPPDLQPDLDESALPRRADPGARAGRCRVCGESGSGAYCLGCLAETMEPLPAAPDADDQP